MKSLQSCLTLCDPIDGSPWGSPVPGILQARTLEWVAIAVSNVWKWKVKVKSLSRVWLLATPWTAGYQALPSMGFSRQEHWSGVPLPSPHYWRLSFSELCIGINPYQVWFSPAFLLSHHYSIHFQSYLPLWIPVLSKRIRFPKSLGTQQNHRHCSKHAKNRGKTMKFF